MRRSRKFVVVWGRIGCRNVVHAGFWSNLAVRTVTVVTRECLAIEVGRSFTSDDVIGVLQYLFAIRGVPAHIRSDNGPKFVAKGIRRWLLQAGVSTLFIARSSPWENGYVESVNAKFRDELLNGELFLGLEHARWVIDRWRLDYNHQRPQGALDYQTPAAFAATCVLEDSATLHPPGLRTPTDPKLSHSEWYNIWGWERR